MSDDGCRPLFHTRQVENKAKSREAGRPIYEDVEYVEILIPGSKNERPVRRVNSNDRERWPEAYRRFKDGQAEAQSGTPLEQWPRMSRSRVMELKAVGIATVEDLAAVKDSNLQNIGPDGRELRQNANNFLKAADEDVGEMQNRIKELEAKVEELEAENAELRQNQRKKPGPKPKDEAA